MVQNNIYFENAKQGIKDFFELEFPALPESDTNKIINIFYRLSNYEEEGIKIRPCIFLTNNINYVVKTIPNCYKLTIYIDKDTSSFKQRLKALMCFCKNEWNIYINYNENGVEYGLVKALNSMKDKSLNSLIFDDFRSILQTKCYLANISVISGGLIVLTGLKGNKLGICFTLNDSVAYDWDNAVGNFVDACISKIKTSARKLNDIKNIYNNVFQKVLKGLHGTICLVIDKDYVDTKGFLEDGTWLKEPIEFGKLFLQSKNYNDFKLSGYSDLLFTMLNYDGITVVDNAGRIRAYNVFIENNSKISNNITGGARRRAAYTLLNHKNKRIIGVYFQSQDGDNFYKESLYGKKKKTIEETDFNLLPLEKLAHAKEETVKDEKKG